MIQELDEFESLVVRMYGPYGKSQIWMDKSRGKVRVVTKELHPDTVAASFKSNPMLSVFTNMLCKSSNNSYGTLTFWLMFCACLRYHYTSIDHYNTHPITMSRAWADIRTKLLPKWISVIKSQAIDFNSLQEHQKTNMMRCILKTSFGSVFSKSVVNYLASLTLDWITNSSSSSDTIKAIVSKVLANPDLYVFTAISSNQPNQLNRSKILQNEFWVQGRIINIENVHRQNFQKNDFKFAVLIGTSLSPLHGVNEIFIANTATCDESESMYETLERLGIDMILLCDTAKDVSDVVPPRVLQRCNKNGILVVPGIEPAVAWDICSRAALVAECPDLPSLMVGKCDGISVTALSHEKSFGITFYKESGNTRFPNQLLLKGSSMMIVTEYRNAILKALGNLEQVLESGCVIPGGGAEFLKLYNVILQENNNSSTCAAALDTLKHAVLAGPKALSRSAKGRWIMHVCESSNASINEWYGYFLESSNSLEFTKVSEKFDDSSSTEMPYHPISRIESLVARITSTMETLYRIDKLISGTSCSSAAASSG